MIFIIQARLSSKRLPNKVLKKINNKELLMYIIERIKEISSTNQIYVATSNNDSDQEIVNFCKSNNFNYYQGDLENVAKRFLDILKLTKCDSFVRICADSPLIDQNLILKMIKIYDSGEYDIVTNRNSGFPSGQTVEIINSKKFINSYNFFQTSEHFEHVTSYFYQITKNETRSFFFKSQNDYKDLKLSVDTQLDFERISNIIRLMKKKHVTYDLKKISELVKNLS
jgi:spore coat polysaccharide biosynthesis protein SpsF